MKPITGLVFVVLIVALCAIGVLYYQETKDDVNVKIDLPKVTVD